MLRVFSAPGKALVAGGYLVLDPQYNSYVTALSSRMHARVEKLPTSGKNSSIVVKSPQFSGAWSYEITHREGFCEITCLTGGKNPFLEETIKIVFAYVRPETPFNYSITLFSDAGFHTQENTEKNVSENAKKEFLYHAKPIDQVPKTGMGLSAGLVSVVASALLATMLDKPVSAIADIIHNVSQISHCGAQGKIGSGFDVAAAVYGSIIYKRFHPSVINELLDQPVSKEFCVAVKNVVDSKWDFTHARCNLPPSLRLIMGDVNGGSETPKLVSKVMEWRKQDPNSKEVYDALNLANSRLMAELQRLNQLHFDNPIGYEQELEAGTLFMSLSNCISAIREGLQDLTLRSGAAVEPPEQTHLLNKCEELPGCLGGVVPGAGGYDAVCLLVEDSQVESFKKASESDAAFNSVTWLELNEESQGIIEESAEDYKGL